MQKKKIQLQQIKLSSFKTSAQVTGGTSLLSLDPLACTAFCGTGETCPECAYTLPGQYTCEQPRLTDGC